MNCEIIVKTFWTMQYYKLELGWTQSSLHFFDTSKTSTYSIEIWLVPPGLVPWISTGAGMFGHICKWQQYENV